ncbi:unnamed protein product, partial [Choristocarpus tenellus]
AQVSLDLQPCILAASDLVSCVGGVAETYVMSQWYKGFWSASQVYCPTDTLGFTNQDGSGKCDSIFVGIVPTADQKAELQAYARTFSVRIVYFDTADTANDVEVNERLRVSQYFAEPLFSTDTPIPAVAGNAACNVCKDNMQTNPQTNNLYARPLHQWGSAFNNGTAVILASYASASGDLLDSGEAYPSAAAVEWIGSDGLEELHVFFSIAWFDMGSWAWANFFAEWATRGVFQGERRYYLGPVVDDLLLGTVPWEYDGADNMSGEEERMSGDDFATFASFQDSLNSMYGADVITEFAYNGNGVLQEANSAFTLSVDDVDIAKLTKGDKVQGTGKNEMEGTLEPQHSMSWLSTAVPGMQQEFEAGAWESDGLFAAVLRNVEFTKAAGFYYGNENYNWYSMTSPGISGLFNKYCLESGAAEMMTCYPGDNTYLPGVTSVSLVAENRYHPLTTTVSTNGYAGATIVPRFATFIYYNCRTPECLVQENEWIRRVVCGCANLDPSADTGTCSLCDDIQSFGSLDAIIGWEKEATTRQILGGFRDKYMFHQLNLLPTTINGATTSLLAYWMEQMMAEITSFITFPI